MTGKTVGWEPIEQSAFAKFWRAAVDSIPDGYEPGTYELVGPKVNGNPERTAAHRLVAHATADRLELAGLTFEGLRDTVITLMTRDGIEGIVWHRNPDDPDTQMAKLKGRDFS
jgi:hypothetical protein